MLPTDLLANYGETLVDTRRCSGLHNLIFVRSAVDARVSQVEDLATALVDGSPIPASEYPKDPARIAVLTPAEKKPAEKKRKR
jgi:hypothetical protein